MSTFTEDAIQRRELASLGVTAEVESDGHQAVVRLDMHNLDALISAHTRPGPARSAFDEGYSRGFKTGRTIGWHACLVAINALQSTGVAGAAS